MNKRMKDFLKEKQSKQNLKQSKKGRSSKKGSNKVSGFKKGHIKKG